MKKTKVTLQVIPKNPIDVCVVNVAEQELRGYKLNNDIGDTYCRIIHKAMYHGHTINADSKELPTAMVEELTSRMERQVIPSLVEKGITCEQFFKVREHQEIKSAYTSYANSTIYEVEVDVAGCPEGNIDHNIHHYEL